MFTSDEKLYQKQLHSLTTGGYGLRVDPPNLTQFTPQRWLGPVFRSYNPFHF